MSGAAEAFEEHLNVLAALNHNYAKKDDAQRVAEVVQLQQQLREHCVVREEEVKSAIKALTHRVKEAEARAAYPLAEGAHERRVGEMAGASSAAKENVDALSEELQALQAQRAQVKEQSAGVQQRSQEVEQMVAQAEPRTRHHISLYAHISSITWQFDRCSHRSVVGVVSDPDRGDIRPFSFDPELTPTFDIVNALWDLMEGHSADGGSSSGGGGGGKA